MLLLRLEIVDDDECTAMLFDLCKAAEVVGEPRVL